MCPKHSCYIICLQFLNEVLAAMLERKKKKRTHKSGTGLYRRGLTFRGARLFLKSVKSGLKVGFVQFACTMHRAARSTEQCDRLREEKKKCQINKPEKLSGQFGSLHVSQKCVGRRGETSPGEFLETKHLGQSKEEGRSHMTGLNPETQQ